MHKPVHEAVYIRSTVLSGYVLCVGKKNKTPKGGKKKMKFFLGGRKHTLFANFGLREGIARFAKCVCFVR
jgi:hypothetical protein